MAQPKPVVQHPLQPAQEQPKPAAKQTTKKPAFLDDSDDDEDDEDFKFKRPGTQASAASKPKPVAAAPVKAAPAQPKAQPKPAAQNSGKKKGLFDSDSDDEY